MRMFDWIKCTKPEERTIAQWFVLYACTWGLFFLSILCFMGVFGWFLSACVDGMTTLIMLRIIVTSLGIVAAFVFSCATIRYFDMWK